MVEAVSQNWGSRALERQIGTLYYERLLASRDRPPVREEASRNLAAFVSNYSLSLYTCCINFLAQSNKYRIPMTPVWSD
jgi:predicted nuclease of restriction endonuclease-like (RecB) superfamily